MSSIRERISQVSHISENRLLDKPPLPKSVKIEVTARCDLQCYFCAVTYKDRGKGHIDKKFLFGLLDQIRAAGVEEVGLFWMGEPFLNLELPEYVAYAKQIGFPYVFLTTNGRMASRDKLQKVFDSGLDSIKFSINADSRENFEKVCGVKGFDRVIENIKTAREVRGPRKKPAIYASSVYDPLNKENYHRIGAMIASYVDEHYPLHIRGGYTLKENGEETDPSYLNTLESKLPCWPLFTLPYISYDGFMSACFCDFDSRLFMANLNEVSFAEAWHSPKFAELRRHHLNKNVVSTPCEQCIAYS